MNVKAFNVALGSRQYYIEVPTLDLTIATNFGGITLGKPHHEQPDAPMNLAKVVPLDDLVRDDDVVDFIKIDVEGGELGVLKGAAKILKRDKPVLFVETDHTETDKDQLLSYIKDAGYMIDQQGPNALCLPVTR
jgi:FkbM family methyltransferase